MMMMMMVVVVMMIVTVEILSFVLVLPFFNHPLSLLINHHS